MWLARGLFCGVNGAGCDLRCSYAPAPKQASAQVLRLGADHTQPLMYTLLVEGLARRCRAAVAVLVAGIDKPEP